MSWKEKLQHKYALSEQGANDMIKAFLTATVSNIVLMFPVGLLYFLVIRRGFIHRCREYLEYQSV